MPMNYCLTEKTRKRMSEAAKKRSTPEYRRRISETKTTTIDTNLAKFLYDYPMSLKEVGEVIGVSQKVVRTHLIKHGIPLRNRAKLNQWGSNNSSWKGDKAGYSALHERMVKHRGQPKKCDWCGTTNPSKTYHWASISRRYHDPEDYCRLCCSCHHYLDGTGRRRR